MLGNDALPDARVVFLRAAFSRVRVECKREERDNFVPVFMAVWPMSEKCISKRAARNFSVKFKQRLSTRAAGVR